MLCQRGCQKLLVFEDDLLPTNTYSMEHMENIVQFLNSHTWDMFFLGYFVLNYDILNPFVASQHVSKHIVSYHPLATHAFCYHRSAMKKVLQTYERFIGKMHYDIYLAQLKLESYCYVPMLFEQKMCMPSDVPAINLMEKGLRSMQCLSEKTSFNHSVSSFKFYYMCMIQLVLLLVIVTCVVWKQKNKFN